MKSIEQERKNEREQQRGKIKKDHLVVRNRKQSFVEDLIADRAGDIDLESPNIPKVSCLVDLLQMEGSYDFVEKLWFQLFLIIGQVKAEVARSRDEVVVSSVMFSQSIHFISGFTWSIILHGMVPGIFSRVVEIDVEILSSRKGDCQFGLYCKLGTKTQSIVLQWLFGTALTVMPHVNFRWWGHWWLLLVSLHQSLPFLRFPMC